MMPTPVLDTHLQRSLPVLALARQRRHLLHHAGSLPNHNQTHKIPSLKTPAARSCFNLPSAHAAKQVSLPLRVITGAPELVAKSP